MTQQTMPDRPEKVSRQRSLEMQRAEYAWHVINDIDKDKQIEEEAKEDIYQLAKGAPADIQVNGLGQIMAFWRSKGKLQHKKLDEHLSGWLRQQIGLTQNTDVLNWIIEDAGTDDYRRATAEAIAMLIWEKRFAEAKMVEIKQRKKEHGQQTRT